MSKLVDCMKNRTLINLNDIEDSLTELEKEVFSQIEFLFIEVLKYQRICEIEEGEPINAFLEYGEFLFKITYDGSFSCYKYDKRQLKKNCYGEYIICESQNSVKYKELVRRRIDDEYRKAADKLSYLEYEEIKNKLIGKRCVNCTNSICRKPYYDKIGIDDDGNELGEPCISWDNQRIIGASKVLCLTNISDIN